MRVNRWCDGSFLEDQDFWRLSGIGRDCYLYARDKRRLADVRLTPDLVDDYRNGTLRAEIATTPGMFDAVEYYGRGPMENYADRSGAAFVGRYAQRVADQFHMKYVSPQESGTRSGLRWWRLTDDSGLGVEICSDRHFSASAIPFAIPQLDNGSPEYVRHPGDLVPDGRTHVNIESVQSGLGCVNSWGRLPRPEYLLPYGDYSFNFLLRPVAGGR